MIMVKYLDLPCRVKATSTKNEDGSYTVIINSRLSYEQQLKGYIHEIIHIINNDFENKDINSIECKAHQLVGGE